jgi:hypothetical protein
MVIPDQLGGGEECGTSAESLLYPRLGELCHREVKTFEGVLKGLQGFGV